MHRAAILLSLVSLTLGCGRKPDESLARHAGNTVAEGLSDFASGVGEGVDAKLAVLVELSPEVKELGVSSTVSKSNGIDPANKGFTVDLLSKESFQATFVAKAFNRDDLEIGRARVDVAFENDDAQYVKFVFDKEMDSALVARYRIDLAK